MLRGARKGGSITPPWAARIRQLETTGSLQICTHTSVSSASWDNTQQRWSLDLVTTTDGREVLSQATPNYIVAATGAAPAFSSLPFVKDFAQRHPLPEVGGLPCLTQDRESHRGNARPPLTRALQSNTESFRCSALVAWQDCRCDCCRPASDAQADSSIHSGPAAGNLGGMREAADRVATRLGELSLGTPSNTTEVLGSSDEGLPTEEKNATSGGREWFGFSALAVEG
jgi:hypothetical protein